MAAYPNGTQLLIKWSNDGDTAHARIMCGHFGGASERYVVMLPSGDLSDAGYGADGIDWVRVRPPGGGLPFGLQVGNIEDMTMVPSDDELQALCIESAADIRKLKVRNPQLLAAVLPVTFAQDKQFFQLPLAM